jgi:hypothetical protein
MGKLVAGNRSTSLAAGEKPEAIKGSSDIIIYYLY